MMYELTGAELDAVSAGHNQGNAQANGFGGLLGVGAAVGAVSVIDDSLNNNQVDVRLLNGDAIAVPVGIAVALLGIAGNVVRGQAAA